MDYTILTKTIYKANEHYVQYRIPGMVVTKKGTLLLYNEARTQGSDWAKMDIILTRSTDGGKTFSDATILVQSDDTHKTVNNPIMVCDNDNKIHFFYCEDYSINGGRVLHSVSLDDGLTFSKPKWSLSRISFAFFKSSVSTVEVQNGSSFIQSR